MYMLFPEDGDDHLMDLIHEDLLSVSEFGDPCYYEHFKEMAEEQTVIEKHNPSPKRASGRRRRGPYYASLNDSEEEQPVVCETQSEINRRIAAEMQEKNHSEMHRPEYLERVWAEQREEKRKKEKLERCEPLPKPIVEESVPAENKKEEPKVVQEKPPAKKEDRKKRNALLQALQKKQIEKSVDDITRQLENMKNDENGEMNGSVNVTKHQPVNTENDQIKTVTKTLADEPAESIDVTDQFKNLLTDDTDSSSAYTTASSSSLRDAGDSQIKPKKKGHTTSRRRCNINILLTDPIVVRKPYDFKPLAYDSTKNFNLESSSDFPKL